MIVLDTNVFSEVLKPAPSEAVLRWLRAQDRTGIFITAVTGAEALYGVERLPAGMRRKRLEDAIEGILEREYAGQILPFDEHAARFYAQIVTNRKAAGRPMSPFDAMIAAIARLHRFAVATRNTADFEHCGVRLINPWREG